VLTTGEMGKLIGVSPITIINWMEGGKLPFERIGPRGRRKISEREAMAFVRQQGLAPERLDQEIWGRILDDPGTHQDVPGLFFTARDFQCVHWNSQAQALLGWNPIDVMGTRLEKVKARVPGMEVDLQTLSELPPEVGATLVLHIEMLHRNGNWLPMELVLNWIHGANESIEGVAFVCRAHSPI
jgi:excisionase family DNA binding protein